MIPFLGVLLPPAGRRVRDSEAPFKTCFFGAPVDPAAVPAAAEDDALYLNGKQPEPRASRPSSPPFRSDR